MISTGQTQPTASTSSLRWRLGRPGCTRYQWPSSIASVTAPRNAALAKVRSNETPRLPPASTAAATSPTMPRIGAIRSTCGGNSGPATRSLASRSIPVISATRSRPTVVLVDLAGDPGLAAHDRQNQGEQRCSGDGRSTDLADPDQPESGADDDRRGSHQQVDAPKQPAVAEADFAAPGREPQEREPPDRPLQQHRCSVETDHAGQATSQPIADGLLPRD